mmetsp:Transcript_600/g.1548  ORF Transcript_600/g.1548 Transcript_600/m.1548 type:complete len:98 (-) Transcript_600:2549-2842(-)
MPPKNTKAQDASGRNPTTTNYKDDNNNHVVEEQKEEEEDGGGGGGGEADGEAGIHPIATGTMTDDEDRHGRRRRRTGQGLPACEHARDDRPTRTTKI